MRRAPNRALSGAELCVAVTLALFVALVPALVSRIWSLPHASAVAKANGRWHPVTGATPTPLPSRRAESPRKANRTGAPAAAERPALRPLTGYLVARVTGRTLVRSRPAGKPLVRITPRTEFRSPRVLGALEHRGRWVQVVAPEIGNGRTGWVHESKLELARVARSLRLDLSRRQLVLLEGDRVLRRITVAVGRPGTPTPTGRYAVTDKLRVADPRSPYGCCAIALSARQPKIPPGWPGGDRVAIHATRDLASLGEAASFGCVRGRPEHLRRLMREVPLGAPIFVRA